MMSPEQEEVVLSPMIAALTTSLEEADPITEIQQLAFDPERYPHFIDLKAE